VNILLYLCTMRAGKLTETGDIGLPLPFYGDVGWEISWFFVMYDVILIANIILCVWPAVKLDYLKKVVISGFGIFMFVGHVFLSLPLIKEFGQFTWGLSCIIGLLAAILSLTVKYENISYTIVGSYALSYIILVMLRSTTVGFYMVIFAILLGVFFVLCRFSPRWHYALCKSLFVGLLMVTFLHINVLFLDIFGGFHKNTGTARALNRLFGLVVFFATAGLTFMITIYYDLVKEKVIEYRNVIAGEVEVPEKV